MFEAGLKEHILAQTGVTNLIGTRFYPVVVPQKVTTYPLAVYRRLPRTEQRYELLTKSSAVVTAFIGITAYATTYDSAKDVAEAFRNELDGFGGGTFGTTNATTINHCKQIDESDGFLPSLEYGGTADLFSVEMVYQIGYMESEPTL